MRENFGGFSTKLTQAIRHLRNWGRGRRSRARLRRVPLTRVARGEVKELRRLLVQSGVPLEEVSQTTPALLRKLVERNSKLSKIINWCFLGAFVPILANALFIPVLNISSGRAKYDGDFAFGIMFMLLALFFWPSKIRHFERLLRYFPGKQKRLRKQVRRSSFDLLRIVLATLSIAIAVNSAAYVISSTTWKDWCFIVVQILVYGTYIFLGVWLAPRILRWLAPDLVLVRALADAIEIAVEEGPAGWRNVSRRSRVAQYINKAADTLEGPIARKFVKFARRSEAAGIQKRLLMAGAALRDKIAWLASYAQVTDA
jgi:hypothetical protein